MNRPKHPKLVPILLTLLVVFLSSCASEKLSDAYGQFEATEITVSAELGGKLLEFNVDEGELLQAGKIVGFTDTVQLHLKKEELRSQLQGTRAKLASLDAEVAVLGEELAIARTDLNRLESLQEDGAATQKQLDDARGRVNVLMKQTESLEVQKQTVQSEMSTIRVRIRQVEEQIEDAKIINPVKGTVLTVFAEPGELVGQGSPLYDIAELDTLELKVFVSGAQLPDVRLNQRVEVLIDKNDEENRALEGWVSWIASEAEFTPKMIQTKEERVNQVYALKVKVPNPEGLLKIGMPGEINFK